MSLEEQAKNLMEELEQLENYKGSLQNKFFNSVFYSLKNGEIAKVLSESYLTTKFPRLNQLAEVLLPGFEWEENNTICKIRLSGFLKQGSRFGGSIFNPSSEEYENLQKTFGDRKDYRVGDKSQLIFRMVDKHLKPSDIFVYSESINTTFHHHLNTEDKSLKDADSKNNYRLDIAKAQISESDSEEFILNQAKRFFHGNETEIMFRSIFKMETEERYTDYAGHYRLEIFNPRKESLKVFGIEFPFEILSNEFSDYFIRGLDLTKLNSKGRK